MSTCLETEAELQVLLGLLPESKGGAGLLALGLLSTSARCVSRCVQPAVSGERVPHIKNIRTRSGDLERTTVEHSQNVAFCAPHR